MIAGHALGLTPLVFLIAAVLFALTAMTYVEGASLHQERSGSTVFARYAFNELVSFVAGWAILLDYVILIAVTCYSATQYLRVFWSPLGHSAEALGLALAFIALVVLGNIRGFGWRRARRVGDPRRRRPRRCRGSSSCSGSCCSSTRTRCSTRSTSAARRRWSDLVFALTVAVISFTEPRVGVGAGRRGAHQPRPGSSGWSAAGTATVVFIYVGIALVAVTALPVHGGHTQLATRYLNDAVDRHRRPVHPHWLAESAALRRRRRSATRDARGGRQLGDARALAAGLLALDQPPDPERPRTSAPAALDAVRADHPRRA